MGEFLGINTRADLARVQTIMRTRILEQFMLGGVTIVDPYTTYIWQGTQIGQDTVVFPNTVIENDVVIGRGCHIGPFCRLGPGTRLEDHVKIASFVDASSGVVVGRGAMVATGTMLRGPVAVKPHATTTPGSVLVGAPRSGTPVDRGSLRRVAQRRRQPWSGVSRHAYA